MSDPRVQALNREVMELSKKDPAELQDLSQEIAARSQKLRTLFEAQLDSFRARMERRVNRIPPNMRSMNIVDLLKMALPPTESSSTREQNIAANAPVRGAQGVRHAEHARDAQRVRDVTRDTQQTRGAQPPQPARATPATRTATKPAAKPTKPSATTTIKRTKRSSDEISGSGKENAADLAVPRKRARAAAAPKPAAVPHKPAAVPAATKVSAARKPSATRTNSGSGKENVGELAVPRVRAKAAVAAPPTRQTRAVSKKIAPAEVLSPKSHNSRPIRTTRATRRPA
ncbi:hypothetical protein P154DRAFT_620890 [Amniculicola lignicola CBS 123094]|uniref:Borealin N-terminal domain-containing protein n=1 Tax=Amniculicola lignicola CBS 123094 TaxID=1392246 RepID=A0A6A5WC50_9PLEO|nr:hypothetical protein P154DRAFT_620890 [Amniculicola lignicola CBS 123094]